MKQVREIIPECCKQCEYKNCYPNIFPCNKCWNIGNEPKYENCPHKKRHNKH